MIKLDLMAGPVRHLDTYKKYPVECPDNINKINLLSKITMSVKNPDVFTEAIALTD